MDNNTESSISNKEYGLFYGLSMILLFVLVYALGIDPIENPLFGVLNSILSYLILPIVFIYLGISTFKKNNFGYASLGECLKTGVSIAFIASLIFAIFSLIFNYIFPEYTEEILDKTRSIMLKQNPSLTSDQVETAIGISRKFSSPIFSIPTTILMFSFLGLIYSLIIGLIVKKDKTNFN